MRDRPGLNLLLVIVAAVPVIASIVDFAMAQSNRTLRNEVNRRQHEISLGGQIAHANEALVRQIAIAAVRQHDAKLRELLQQNGITINVTPPAAPGSESGKGE